MHYQVIIRTHSGNTIEGAILPGDAETAADKIDDMLAYNDTLAIEQAGFTAHALVPVEVEEETVVDTADLDLDPEHEYRSDDPNLLDAVRNAPKRTRYTTPWKTSGPSPHRRGGCA